MNQIMLNKAILLGAVKAGAHCCKERAFTNTKGLHYVEKPISWHFFNREGKEVFYYHPDLAKITNGVEIQRWWGEEALSDLQLWTEL